MTGLLKTITELSHEFGTAEYVLGGGGNTSCKNADTLWVKPSGTTLAGLREETFVEMDRGRLGRLFQLAVPQDKAAREVLVKDVMTAAVKSGAAGRPSVEAPLHDVLGGTYVVHTHPVWVNGLTCSRDAASACRRLFPEALWVPYVDPGYTLCMDVHRRIQDCRKREGGEPGLLFLENHGVFVSGQTAHEVRATYDRVMTALRGQYAAAGVALELKRGQPGPASTLQAIEAQLRGWLGNDAAGVVHCAPFKVAEGPLSPDHIVYSKSYSYSGPLTKEGLDAFRARFGYSPRVLATPEAVFGLGASPKQAQLALDLARDGALVVQLAEAFGGARYLDGAAREFIENWEVESYRSRQMA